MIVENGIGLHEHEEADGMIHDDARIEYFANHIAEMKKAVELDGVTSIGYCPSHDGLLRHAEAGL